LENIAALGVLGSATVEPASATSRGLVLEINNWEAAQGEAMNHTAMRNERHLSIFCPLLRCKAAAPGNVALSPTVAF